MLIRASIAVLSLTASQACACDIALALAVDVSGSVDASEYAIQMQGLAVGLTDTAVAEALVNAQARVMLMQWTGTGRQVVSIPWTPVESHAQVTALADSIATTPRRWRDYRTAIGEAIEMSVAAFSEPAAATCARHVIDISGDGPSNEGRPPENVRTAAALRGITINAIAIEESETELTAYYRDHVITGLGAFVVRAASFKDYPDRIRQKLLREIVPQYASRD